jgi:hypothetical protein
LRVVPRIAEILMRNISFALTTPQFIAGTKTVTRRVGWRDLKSGDLLCAVEKGMGLGKGGKVKRLGTIRVVSATCERLDRMTAHLGYGAKECALEGFPEMTPEQFVEFFCRTHKPLKPRQWVTRIEFERLSSQHVKNCAYHADQNERDCTCGLKRK